MCSFSGSDSWVILSPIELSIKRKIEAVGTPLKDWDIQINYGIKTGCNEAFIISGEKRNEILANCQTKEERERTAELIRPILRGRDIKRYSAEFADLWLIWIPWHFPLHHDKTIKGVSLKAEEVFKVEYPSVYSHLLSHKSKLENRNKAETGIRYEWYALQRWGAEYWEDFSKPKIVYPNMTKYMPFYLDMEGLLVNQKCFILTGEDLSYLTAFFNSNVFKICYREMFPELQGGTRELSKIFFERIKVPPIDNLISYDFQIFVEDKQQGKDNADIRLEKALIRSLNLEEYEEYIFKYNI